ncbi:MAG TPA: lipoprotein-releasing ABC transporter permease subunit [Gammaproteobacteria bacterium]|jgi:lipoprotein-releasing system permease protein
MFRPLECFIGFRYLRSGRRRGVVSFMTAASFLGIALGVAALIVILSVLNGFETENRTRLLSMTEHVGISAAAGGLADWESLAARIAARDDVTAVAPFVELEGMLAVGRELRPALVRGVLPETATTEYGELVDAPALAAFAAGQRRILLGRFLALNLGVEAGQALSLWLPRVEDGRVSVSPVAFTVAGTFAAGAPDHDTRLALVSLADASALAHLGGAPKTLGIRLVDPLRAPAVAAALAQELGPTYVYTSWTERYASLFRAMRVEKVMMTIILAFIVGVAAFNIVTSLMMVVNEKEKDIAILRTYGLEPGRVTRIFFVQGAVIGCVGTVVGVVLGLVLATNVHVIVPWLEGTFGFRIMPGDVFYVTEIPSEVHLGDVVLVPLLAFAISVIATLYPSRRAARVAPARALRYE